MASKEVPFQCSFCGEKHSVYKCVEFLKKEPQGRFKWAKDNKICYLCLQKHGKNECKSKFNCKICENKHNVLLHLEKKVSIANETNVSALIATRDENNLLATAMVNVRTKNGDKILLRAVVDMGSQSPMITERAQQALGLDTENVCAEVDGVDAIHSKASKRAQLVIYSRFTDEYALHIKPLVMKNITSLKVFKDDLAKYEHLQNLRYADPTTSSNQPIDILLCVADYSRIIKPGLIKKNDDEPIAQNSELGWLVMGPDCAKNDSVSNSAITTLISNTEIEEKIMNLFELSEIEDSCSSTKEQLTEEEKFCEEYFVKTTKKDVDGRFIVSMPFKNN